MPELLTLTEAAERLGTVADETGATRPKVSVDTLRREAADGRLAIVRIRRRVYVRAESLERYINEREQAWHAKSRESANTATAGRSESAQARVTA